MEKKCYEAPSMEIIIVEAHGLLADPSKAAGNAGFNNDITGSSGQGDDSPRGRESGWETGYDFDVEDWEE